MSKYDLGFLTEETKSAVAKIRDDIKVNKDGEPTYESSSLFEKSLPDDLTLDQIVQAQNAAESFQNGFVATFSETAIKAMKKNANIDKVDSGIIPVGNHTVRAIVRREVGEGENKTYGNIRVEYTTKNSPETKGELQQIKSASSAYAKAMLGE